jgi:hypothetical protein
MFGNAQLTHDPASLRRTLAFIGKAFIPIARSPGGPHRSRRGALRRPRHLGERLPRHKLDVYDRLRRRHRLRLVARHTMLGRVVTWVVAGC